MISTFSSLAVPMSELQDHKYNQSPVPPPKEATDVLQQKDQQDQDEDQAHGAQKQEKLENIRDDKSELLMVAPSLELKEWPSLEANRDAGNECKTPQTGSSDQRSERAVIVDPKFCPPAPRKPKSLPSVKRRASWFKRSTLLDVSKEVEALFPRAVLEDFGKKIKKARAA